MKSNEEVSIYVPSNLTEPATIESVKAREMATEIITGAKQVAPQESERNDGDEITADTPLDMAHYDIAWRIIDCFGVKAS